VSSNGYRLVFALLGLALAAVVIWVVAVAPSGRDVPLPAAVERISPADGDTVLRQIGLVIDMQPGYAIELYVDGTRIPPGEIRSIAPTGRFEWSPGPEATFPEWTPGVHAVHLTWDRVNDLPDPGELSWTFRVQ
jgi:hypothetical protein